MNRGLVTSLATVALAQIVKPPLFKLKTGKWDWQKALDAGGMPSSHSAGVTSFTTYVALKKGINSAEFALSTIFSLIVMYDAMGIRKHTGEIAKEVNEHEQEIEQLQNKRPGLHFPNKNKPLKISLGHQPEEVLAGVTLGIATGGLSYWLKSKAPHCPR